MCIRCFSCGWIPKWTCGSKGMHIFRLLIYVIKSQETICFGNQRNTNTISYFAKHNKPFSEALEVSTPPPPCLSQHHPFLQGLLDCHLPGEVFVPPPICNGICPLGLPLRVLLQSYFSQLPKHLSQVLCLFMPVSFQIPKSMDLVCFFHLVLQCLCHARS